MTKKTISQSKKLQCLINTEGHCWYCGKKLVMDGPYNGDAFVVDHVVPKYNGGTDEISNLVACCVSCNSSKCHKTLEVFRDWYEAKNGMSFTPEQRFYWKHNHSIELPEDDRWLFSSER